MAKKEFSPIRQGSRMYTVYVNGTTDNRSDIADFADATTSQPFFLKLVYVGTTGNVALMLEGDTVATTIPSVTGGQWHNMGRVKRILSTGTTADNIFGQYDFDE